MSSRGCGIDGFIHRASRRLGTQFPIQSWAQQPVIHAQDMSSIVASVLITGTNYSSNDLALGSDHVSVGMPAKQKTYGHIL